MGIFRTTGSFQNIENFLTKLSKFDITKDLNSYGQRGVDALINATPEHSGLAAHSWTYKIEANASGVTLSWHNIDVENGFPVAIMLQYGYATGTGGYVHGRDYVNPAIKPIFDQIENDLRKVVST